MEFWQIICLGYMLIGLITFEWSWAKTAPMRIPNEERDSKYPAFRRLDKQWRKWRYYPGALLFLPGKFIFIMSIFFFGYIYLRMVCLGHDLKRGQNPLVGTRKKLVQKFYKIVTPCFTFAWSLRSTLKKVDYDYSEYLGKDYLQKQQLPRNISTYVAAGHTSAVDNFINFSHYGNVKFVSKASLIKAPVLGFALQTLGTLFINRASSEEERNKIIDDIIKRQIETESSSDPSFEIIFADSTTSNNAYVLPLKKGAFAGLRAVTPLSMHYDYNDISPAIDVNFTLPLIFLQFSLIYAGSVTTLEFPPFLPNDYLFEKHKDKGEEKWQIFAWALRDIISKSTGKPLIESQIREKLAYEQIIKDELRGKTKAD